MASLSQRSPFQAPTSTPQSDPSDVLTFDNAAEGTYKDLPLWCVSMQKRHASAVARHRYPNVPGQTIEPMGREPIEVTLETAWFGEDWRDRLENLIYTKDVDQTSGRLVLPDGRGEFDAFLISLDEQVDLTMSGAVVSLTFEEDCHTDAYIVAAVDDLAAADADIPAAQLACRDSFDEYEGLTTATSQPATREVYSALVGLETAIAAAQAGCDLLTVSGVQDHMALTRVQWRARRAFPDQTFLRAALG
jgi:prophage DNA circulation protein